MLINNKYTNPRTTIVEHLYLETHIRTQYFYTYDPKHLRKLTSRTI